MDDTEDKLAPGTDDDALIAEAKAYLAAVVKVEGENRQNAQDDLAFLAGEHWDAKVKRERELAGRPALTINKLPTFLHQVTNDQRQNVPSIKVSPVDNGADVKTAEIIQGAIRHIEYASNADVAYDTAVNSAAAIGFGFFRLVTDYCATDSFDQDIRFKRIRNPFTVYMDPFSEEPDGSDQRRNMISDKLSRIDFKRDYPNANASNEGFTLGSGDSSNEDWLGKDFVRIAEYYRIEEEPATLVELTNGETGWKDKLVALPPGVTIKRERKSSRSKTMLYKITALDVLERTEIKCKWIPVFPVYGDEIEIDGKIIRSGIIRNAKDPSRMYDFWMTAATEEVAMRPKTPYIGAEGQFEGCEDDWNDANVKNFSYLEYKQVALDGQLAPAPVRQPMADIPNGILTMAMHANDNIKATTGLFDSSLGAMGNARSGTQERSQQRQGDMANFHFADNLNRTVRHAGRCIVDMFPNYYDATRVLRILGDDDKMDSTTINQPVPEDQQQQQLAQLQQQHPDKPPSQLMSLVQTVLNDVTVGTYDVTVKAGPSYSTLRQEALDGMVSVAGKWPKLMDVAGDKVIQAMDWPGAEEIAERVARTIPKEIRGDDGEEGQPPAPVVHTPKGDIPLDQAAQMLQEMDQHIQQLSGALQEAKSGVEKAKVDADARVKVAEINAVSKSDVAELTGMVQLLIAQIQPPPALTNAVVEDLGEEGGAPAAPPPAPGLMLRAPAPRAPTRKRISIMAPSGQMYHGEIADHEDPPAPPAVPPPAPPAPEAGA